MKTINRELLTLVRQFGLVPPSEESQSSEQCEKIHDLYQDLYLTDLKNDLSLATIQIQKEKSLNSQFEHDVSKLRKEIQD